MENQITLRQLAEENSQPFLSNNVKKFFRKKKSLLIAPPVNFNFFTSIFNKHY
ncbi:MAG: hypothetical protein IPO27_02315 [Bacteroidetes bacterium]|nr:hypothetical protein [Bacteroidota bacterium]